MASLTPPKFVSMLRSRDEATLVSDLRALLPDWEDPDAEIIDGLATRRRCASQLKAILDRHEGR